MGLASLFRDLAQQMLTPGGIFDDIPVPAVYVRQANPLYNPVTGAVTPQETRYNITGVKDKPLTWRIDSINVLSTDRWFYVSQQTLSQAGLVVPSKPDDTMEFLGEGAWTVLRIEGDAADAAYIIQLRRP